MFNCTKVGYIIIVKEDCKYANVGPKFMRKPHPHNNEENCQNLRLIISMTLVLSASSIPTSHQSFC